MIKYGDNSKGERILRSPYDYETEKNTIGIPFYAFYKEIGTSKNGNTIYAKTYVPAIEISGLEEYFERQKDNHDNSRYVVETR